ncbi:unnamed protein product [Eruca vesicaria subsp. sativa]|uniref:Uncharacterized protein n=1 Tax=Eruca vesicaria subsp. sativa TaxID=29727 RepID=A0ABC8LU46_ERUVS|nr:unnamed protein product [Eruca vesicaria subsp. sativa]
MGEINDDWRSDLDISGLSLMDEDDSLLFPDPSTEADKEDRGLDLFGDICDCDDEEEEEVMQPSELDKVMKYNLRKSLAWDKAFFTNPGVLEPDELSNMIESNHVGEKKKILGTIQEDVKRSTESISTLKSDCTVETSQEDCVLFEDVRASIHRSAVSIDDATPDRSKELGEREAVVHSPTSSTLDDPDSHEKMKPNAIRKRPQGLGKVTKQPIAAKEHNATISRPSTGTSRSVRASMDVNKTKQEKNPKLTGRIRPIVSKPGVPSRSALRSSSVGSRNELTSSCSSLESCISASSSASKRSPLESVKQKKAQNLRIVSHSLVNGSTSRAASKLIAQSRVSPFSASSTYKPRLSSNASFLSASVDWSFNSPRASTPNKMAKGKKKPLSVGGSPGIDDTKTLKNSKDISAVQDDHKSEGTASSASMMKPTGLRVPSPKLGYFDGGRSSVARTPTGTCTGPGSGLTKHGARSMNEPSTTSSRIKSQLTGSRLIQDSKAKARPVSRTSRLIVSSSAKLTKKTYSKVSAEEQLNGNLAQ